MHVGHVYAISDPKGNRQIAERIDFEIVSVSRMLSFGKRFSRNLGGVTSAGTKTTLAVSLEERYGEGSEWACSPSRHGNSCPAAIQRAVPGVALLYARTGFGIWDLAGRPLRSLRKMECPSEANRKKEK